MSGSHRNVLIFAHECSPYNRPESTIGAQRPAQFAKNLPDFGWRAIVLCCDSKRRRVTVDWDELERDVRRSLANSDPSLSVIIPTPSLPHDGWLDRAWHACNSGTRGVRLARKGLTIAKLSTGDYSQSWQPCAWRAAQIVQVESPVDCCIGEHTPDAGLFLGRRFASRFQVPWIADFRDPILYPFRPLARRIYRPIAKRLVASAYGTVNVNEVLTSLDSELFGLPSWTISNGYDPDEYPAVVQSAPRGESFVVAYAGSVHQMQRLDVFIEGLGILCGMLQPEDLKSFRFVYRGDSKKVWELVARQGIGAIADLSDRVSRKSLFELLGHADVMLLLSASDCPPEDRVFFGRGFHPGKTFEYFGLRRPILCVPGDGGLLDQLIQETQTGVIATTPQSVAEHLAHAFRAWKAGKPLAYSPDEAALLRHTRRSQAQRLAEILDEATATSGASTHRIRTLATNSGRS